MRRATIFITLVAAALLCASHLFAQNNQPMTIVIDPGHGGYDPGAVATLNGKQYRESSQNCYRADKNIFGAMMGQFGYIEKVVYYSAHQNTRTVFVIEAEAELLH